MSEEVMNAIADAFIILGVCWTAAPALQRRFITYWAQMPGILMLESRVGDERRTVNFRPAATEEIAPPVPLPTRNITRRRRLMVVHEARFGTVRASFGMMITFLE